jgi:hypothetical protein
MFFKYCILKNNNEDDIYLSLLHSVQTGAGAHADFYPMVTGGSFPGVMQPRREADDSPPSSSEVKNGGAIPPLSHTSSW